MMIPAPGREAPIVDGVAVMEPTPRDGGEVRTSGSVVRLLWHTFRENKLALIGVISVVAIALFCFVGPLFYVTDQIHSNLLNVNFAPSRAHLLGTDDNGFDVLGRLMVGGQSSIEVGLAVALIATSLGVIWGSISGFFGGFIDAVMMRIVDVMLAIPVVFLFVFLASIFKPTLGMLIIVLGLLSWLSPARLVRGETLSLRTREYVLAAKTLGGGSTRAIFRHIIPNAVGTIIVNATFQVADAILVLATLSFLGFGLAPPAATWGGMLSNGTNYIFDGYWWQIYPAGLMIVLTVLSFNFIGDGLRDSFEVRLQRR
jgi:peptide/nickel transport system permease protein